ncbi:hypothetical protein BaRGS_00018012, partial [Batillaria attramentaria]
GNGLAKQTGSGRTFNTAARGKVVSKTESNGSMVRGLVLRPLWLTSAVLEMKLGSMHCSAWKGGLKTRGLDRSWANTSGACMTSLVPAVVGFQRGPGFYDRASPGLVESEVKGAETVSGGRVPLICSRAGLGLSARQGFVSLSRHSGDMLELVPRGDGLAKDASWVPLKKEMVSVTGERLKSLLPPNSYPADSQVL